MNWDWDKLQEKRQRQGRSAPPPQGDGEGPLGDFQLGKYLPKGFGNGLPLKPVFVVALFLWLASGIFTVDPGEVGVITRFGKFTREVQPGPNYHLPFPIESVDIVNTKTVRSVVVGRSLDHNGGSGDVFGKRPADDRNEESDMFTGDENIVHMQFTVLYTVKNAYNFLFHMRDPRQTVATAAEAAMREVVGSTKIDSILTDARLDVEARAQKRLTEILDKYALGVEVNLVRIDGRPPVEVAAAFKDVFDARENKAQTINQAEAYRMEVVPVANGTAMAMLNAAEAYRLKVVQEADGEAKRFLAMVEQFNKAKDLTRKRMYLDAMSDMLSSPDTQKVIISGAVKPGSVLPLFNLGAGVTGQPATQGAKPQPQGTTQITGSPQGTAGAGQSAPAGRAAR